MALVEKVFLHLSLPYSLLPPSHTHQLVPCLSQGPRHIQQNSALQEWLRHIMWLHPPLFSMVAWHLGHSWGRGDQREDQRENTQLKDSRRWRQKEGRDENRAKKEEWGDGTCRVVAATLVLTWIQLHVSLSSSHFFNHFRRYCNKWTHSSNQSNTANRYITVHTSHRIGSCGSRPHLKLNKRNTHTCTDLLTTRTRKRFS